MRLRAGKLYLTGACLVILVMLVFAGLAHGAGPGQAAAAAGSRQEDIEKAMGRTGMLFPDGVLKFGMPRSDLNVTVGPVHVAPALALGSWVAFKDTDNGSMVMGDLVLTVDEVNAVMERLQQGGIEQTGLHNHLIGESPRVMYMHITGRGDPVRMAGVIHDALALTGTPTAAPAAAPPANTSLNTTLLDKIIGAKGKYSGGVYQFSIPRAEKITDEGMEVPPSMGVAMPINFQPLGNSQAAITGDFVLTGSEVNPVIRALKDNGINVTAIHNHMINEEPRLFFLHFWATGDQDKLASGLRAALDRTNIGRSP